MFKMDKGVSLAGYLGHDTNDHQQHRQTGQYEVQYHVQRLLSVGFLNVSLMYHRMVDL